MASGQPGEPAPQGPPSVPPAPPGSPPSPDAPAGQPPPSLRELRLIFVQMLFSLTAAEIARQSAELTLREWPPSSNTLPAYAHLILATAVVVMSWVGWTRSEAGKAMYVESVFSWRFMILLTDVFLVILYFILVRGAEVPMPNDPTPPPASAQVETAALAWIFCGYFLWDFLTKAVMQGDGAPPEFRARLFGGAMWKRGWVSAVCMLLGLVAYCLLHSVTGWLSVVLVDLSLLALVTLFRAMKAEYWLLSAVLLLAGLTAGVVAKAV